MHVESTIKNPALVAQKRAVLIRCSAELFLKKGFGRVTIPDIAEASGMSVGSIYRYIRKKEDLMVLLLNFTQELIDEQLLPIADEKLPSMEKLEKAYNAYTTLIRSNRDYFIVSIRDFRLMGDEITQRSRDIEGQIVALFGSILAGGVHNGEFKNNVDIRLIACNLVSLGQSWLTRRHLYGQRNASDFASEQLNLYRAILLVPNNGSEN